MKAEIVNRQKSLRVYLSDSDRNIIETRAKNSNLSVSAYLRKVGMGHRPKSNFDRAVALDLLKVNGDLGRLGGLLKLSLSERTKLSGKEVRELLEKINSTMDEIRWKAAQV